MSLTVKHLNGDTTFLLTFAPNDFTPASPLESQYGSYQQYQQPPGTFSILVDPWISGPSTMWHPKFLLSKHTSPSCVQNLSHIPEPNVVLISQDKPDHCHEATLRQLDPTSPVTTILAEPAAAKRIRGFKFFNPEIVHSLRVYSEKKPDSVIRFYIPPVIPGGTPGEATISLILAKMDVAGTHNAIGITYRPPQTTYNPSRSFSPRSPSSQSSFYRVSQLPPAPQKSALTPPESPTRQNSAMSTTSNIFSNSSGPPSSTFSAHHRTISSSSSVTSTTRLHGEKALSVIYSPHGVDYSLIRAYASSHLVATAALPLTLLLHSFDRVQNPWWLGGNIAAGLPGGIEIAQNLMAKCWISAHDEDKDNSGLAVMSIKTRKYNKQEVSGMLRQGKGSNVDIANLGVGAEIVLKA
ncbi:hypothetical protein OEA41_002361 [Lepraria neglecta]|uniref:Uncharacterized protein n=1 Tax=Lepraria neglecta TaxID=209136 RepID=A0AAD9ZBW9_9LECA|nr:hypothetical protein OEA41_002361 [Lepraria neglecta]